MTDPGRLTEIKERQNGLVKAAREAPPPEPGDERLHRAFVERMLLDGQWLIGEVERLREVEADWNRVREELMNAKRAIANITQRLDLKLDELSKQDAEIARLRRFPAVWAVRYGNYEPSEVIALYDNEQAARAHVAMSDDPLEVEEMEVRSQPPARMP
jgi:hypothetical protein